MRFAARLRRENIPFSLTLLCGCECIKLSMGEFRHHLAQWQLQIPPELSSEYRGDLTEWMMSSPEMLIPGTLNTDEVVHLAGALAPEIILHLAAALRNGCWNGHWNAVSAHMQIVVFADKYNLTRCRNQGIWDPNLSWQTGNLAQDELERASAKASIVILASTEITRDSRRCEGVIKYCVDHGIGVIVLSEAGGSNSFLQRVATKTYFFQIRHSCGKKVFYLVNRTEKFGLRFSIDPTGTLSAVVKLSDKEIANVQPDLQKELPENGVEDFQRTLANDLRQADSGEQNELLKPYFQSGI